MVSDLVLAQELPDLIKESVEAYVGCLAGAVKKEDYLKFIEEAGFKDIRVLSQVNYPVAAMANDATVKAIMEKSHLILFVDQVLGRGSYIDIGNVHQYVHAL